MSMDLADASALSVSDQVTEPNSLTKPLVLTLDGRIDDLAGIARYIDQIDFTLLKSKIILDKDEGLAPEWDSAKTDAVELLYKRYLKVLRKHEHESLPPTRDIDIFWHAHILDTQAYIRDCAAIFGYYLHHYPYFGVRGESDYQRLMEAGVVTRRVWQDEYGEDLAAYSPSKRYAPFTCRATAAAELHHDESPANDTASCIRPEEPTVSTSTAHQPVVNQIPRCARFAT